MLIYTREKHFARWGRIDLATKGPVRKGWVALLGRKKDKFWSLPCSDPGNWSLGCISVVLALHPAPQEASHLPHYFGQNSVFSEVLFVQNARKLKNSFVHPEFFENGKKRCNVKRILMLFLLDDSANVVSERDSLMQALLCACNPC